MLKHERGEAYGSSMDRDQAVKGEIVSNYSAYLREFTGKLSHLIVVGDYYELSIKATDREDEYELTSQANMESSAYRIKSVHDDFILLLEDIGPKKEVAIQFSFLKKIQVSI